jgi:23S rRNA (cytidine1920-2'-O)/16S rRNA (cytidine1409-2'-O)-methyltransferase
MRRLIDEVARLHPWVKEPEAAIAAGDVLVDGLPVTNPSSLVRPGASVVIRHQRRLRGSVKLQAALDRFGVRVEGRVAVDVGAAAGGFTLVLLEAGAERVYAVDVGHGQLLGSLRQDPRVVNLEATNVADLDGQVIPDRIDLVTVDVSYLSLGAAVAQLGGLDLAEDADLMGLVKPMFELRRPNAPTDRASLQEALAVAVDEIQATGWRVVDSMDSPVAGAKGAREMLVRARRDV